MRMLWRGHPLGQGLLFCSLYLPQTNHSGEKHECGLILFPYCTAPPTKCSVFILFLASLLGVKCSTSWEERLGEVIVPEQGLWFYGKQAITVLIFYASLHEPFIYSAPRKIFPSNTLLLNIFSMQPEITYFLSYCMLLSFLYLVAHSALLFHGHSIDLGVLLQQKHAGITIFISKFPV